MRAHKIDDIRCKIRWTEGTVEEATFLRETKSVGTRRYVIVQRDTPEYSGMEPTYEATVPLAWVEKQV